jgi:hypothetical protein
MVRELNTFPAQAGAEDVKDVGERPLSALVAANRILKNQQFENIGEPKTGKPGVGRRTIITFVRHLSTCAPGARENSR